MAESGEARLETFDEWTLRVRPAAVEPERSVRLLVLVHGWTGNEDSMWVFVRHFPSHYWIVAPRAPYTTKPRGYSWRPPASRSSALPKVKDFAPGIQALRLLVDSYGARRGLNVDSFDAIGFSQGAAVAATFAMLQPERVARLAVLAGFVPEDASKLAGTRPLQGKRCFVAHGTLDEMVDIDISRRSVGVLQEAGALITTCEAEVGHRVSSGCLRALESFFG